MPVKTKVKFLQNFVAFSEYMKSNRPWIATCLPPVFFNLPTALPRNKETYRTNMTRIGGKSLSFHCNKAQLGRQPFTHSDAFFRYFWIDITMTFYDPRDTLFYVANRKPGLQKISLKIPTLLSRNQVSYVFFEKWVSSNKWCRDFYLRGECVWNFGHSSSWWRLF